MSLDCRFSDSRSDDATFHGEDLWLSALKAAGRSPATLASYRNAVGELNDWRAEAGGDTDLTTVSKFEGSDLSSTSPTRTNRGNQRRLPTTFCLVSEPQR